MFVCLLVNIRLFGKWQCWVHPLCLISHCLIRACYCFHEMFFPLSFSWLKPTPPSICKPKAFSGRASEIPKLVIVLCSVMSDYDPVDCSPPGSSVHGISHARILERVAISFSRGSSTQGSNPCLLHLLQWQADSLLLHYLGRPSPSWMRLLLNFPMVF